MHGTITRETNQRILLYVGLAALAVGCAMTFAFGLSMSLLHAFALALLTIAAGVIWGPIDRLRAAGRRGLAAFLTGCGVFFICAELFSHLGYTVGNRVSDVEMTTVQNVKHQMAGDAVEDNRASLKMWTERLGKLEAEHGWTATVTAEALRAQLASANLAIEQEAKRGGCGPRCLARTKERDDIASKIALAEERGDIARKIEATRRLVDDRRDKAAATEFKSSKIVNQTKFVSQLATLELDPGAAALTWAQIAIGFVVALVTTFLAPVCLYLATDRTISPAPVGESAGRVRDHLPPQSVPPSHVARRNPSSLETLQDFIGNMNAHAARIGGRAFKAA